MRAPRRVVGRNELPGRNEIAAHFAIASAELPGRNESERQVTSKEIDPETEAAMAGAVEVWPLLER